MDLIGIIALCLTTIISLVITFIWKKVTSSASSDELEKVEKACNDGRKELWLEVNAIKIVQAKTDAKNAAIIDRLSLIQSDLKEIYGLIQNKQDK